MAATPLPNDDLWPRASGWLQYAHRSPDAIILGIPTQEYSLSPTNAGSTPAAIREELARYSHTFATSFIHNFDISELNVVDAGDIEDPDGKPDEAIERISEALASAPLVIGLGGDNSATALMGKALAADAPDRAGLITLDAHFDLRDGHSNGSPVRELIDFGIPGDNIVQIGIADFANSAVYAKRANDHQITVVPRAVLDNEDYLDQAERAVILAGGMGGPIHVDIDVDVCDRSVAPACPASLPGGLSAWELRRFVRRLVTHPSVASIDITEIDASADEPDRRTVRLGALLVLEALTGLWHRKHPETPMQ